MAAAAAAAESDANLGAYIWSESGADLGSLMKKQQQLPQQQQLLQQQQLPQHPQLAGGEALAMKCK